jgi:hypothetical protein
VCDYLGISEVGDEVLIAQLIGRAQAAIDRHCNRTFEASANATRYFDAIGPHIVGRALYLDRDLCSVNSVTNGDGVAVSSTYYKTLPRNDTPYFALQMTTNSPYIWNYSVDWESAIAVSGKWAYSVEAPDDIVQAAVRLAAFYYRQKDAPLQDVTAIEAGVVVKPLAFPDDVRALLAPYRRV